MIAVDTSALMAIVLDESDATACAAVLAAESALAISAATVAEALVVAGRRDLGTEMARLIAGLGVDIVNVTPAIANRVSEAYGKWGKGIHAAALNFGDCFSYVVAKDADCPLLYIGSDFRRTDVRSAL